MTVPLSLEQAPPFSVPLRFFLTAPLFGVAAAGLLLWVGPEALGSRWNAAALALSHLLALGVLGMVMCGALLQLLPVLVGVQVAWPRRLAAACHGLLVPGTLALAGGFLGLGGWAFLLAVALLGAGLGLFLLVLGWGLAHAPNTQDSVRGMRWAGLGLGLVLALGVTLALGHAELGMVLWRWPLTDLHLAAGLIGWIATLIAVVAWQVVPMFQMTPIYPALLRRVMAPGLFGLLAWLGLAQWRGWPLPWLPWLLLAVLLGAFAIVTLQLLAQRRRQVGDSSLAYWRLGMAMLLLSCCMALLAWWLPLAAAERLLLAATMLFLLGFALSIISAMLYKIVPFLIWLHWQQRLSARLELRHRLQLPNMHRILPESRCRRQLHCHAAALVLLLAGVWLPMLVRPAAVLWIASFSLLGYNLLGAALLYRKHCRRIEAGG